MAVAFGYGIAQTIAIICYDGETPTAPTNPVATVSVDGGAFAAADNALALVGPVAFLVLSADEMTGSVVVVKIASDNLADHYGGPYYPGGDYTAARAGYLDKLNVAGALALEATLTAIKGAGWTDETLESISAAIAAAAGSGARTLTFTLSDGAGTVAGSLRTHVEDADGNLVAGPRTTSALGIVTYYLDDGTYYLVSADTAAWTGASNAVVVTASAAVAITLAVKALPPPPAPGKYVVIINAADQTDTAVGASGRSYQVTRVLPAADATADLIRSTERDPVVTDANGQASFEIGQTVESLEVLESWADAAGVARSRTLHLSGFADAADDDGYVQLADVLVRVSGEV